MMNKRGIVFSLMLTLILQFLSSTGIFATGPGTSGARILNQGIGVRPLGMGEAFTAIADDINAIYFNPSGLALLKQREITGTYLLDIADASYSSIGYMQPFNNIGVFGFSFIYYNGGLIEINYLDGTSETRRAQEDYLLTLSYAKSILKNLNFGANIKVLRSTLAQQYVASSCAGDIGILYTLNNLSFGLSIQNIGAPIIYKEKGDPLPLKIKLGSAYRMEIDEENSLVFALDINKPYEDIIQENLGVEYSYKNQFAVRAGYKFGYDSASLTLGGGFVWKFLQIDFSWGLRGNLGNTIQCSLIVR